MNAGPGFEESAVDIVVGGRWWTKDLGAVNALFLRLR